MAPVWANKKRGVSLFDDADDLSMAMSGKKRCLNHDTSESSPCLCRTEELLGHDKRDLFRDADYQLFGEDIDPDYKGFLDHLKADEKSYIYEMKKEDGRSISVKYERWDEIESEHSTPEHKHDMGYSGVDESYAVFLSRLRQNGESMILEYDDYVVRYESYSDGYDESGIDSEVELRCAPYCSRQTFRRSPSPSPLNSSMDEDECSCIESL